MANFTVTGLDEMVETLQDENLLDSATLKEIMYAAGDILVEELKRYTRESGFRLAGYSRGIRYQKKIKRDKYGDPYITVTVTGKNERGQRRATVMFVLNYGRSKEYGEIVGSYFWTRGSKAAEQDVAKEIETIINRKLKERGLL